MAVLVTYQVKPLVQMGDQVVVEHIVLKQVGQVQLIKVMLVQLVDLLAHCLAVAAVVRALLEL
ncbi:MAG: hypothetical protein EBT43_06975 [Methylocystaceae bacterium]|nr:hypothetical protein [Methylocystaceae bacterium]